MRISDWSSDVCSSDLDQQWAVTTRGPDGTENTERFEAVVTATGQLNRPKYPDIPGVGSFEGPAVHSGRRAHHLELAGTRGVVLCTGTSPGQQMSHGTEQARVGEACVSIGRDRGSQD